MNNFESRIDNEVRIWIDQMRKEPSKLNQATKRLQTRLNSLLPDKIHKVITTAIKQVTRSVLYGSEFTTPTERTFSSYEDLEAFVLKRVNFYCKSAAAGGAVTGFGGFVWGIADFPIWLTLKMKLLFEIASCYGHDIRDYRERIYVLYIFQLAFSSQQHRNKIFAKIEDWEKQRYLLPPDIHHFDWKTFQLEYRDHIDLAKIMQLLPGIGAVIGAIVNHRLTKRLGSTAMNAYRLRRQYSNYKVVN